MALFLTAAARTLKAVFLMGEDAAYEAFRRMRWPDTEGEAVFPSCGCPDTYNITSRRRFKCVANGSQAALVKRAAMALPVSRKLAGYWQREA